MATDPTHISTEQLSLDSLKRDVPFIGLTGGIGSGKTAVSDALAKLGAGVVDTDLIAHQITAPNGIAIPLIQKQFGAEYIASNGALDRDNGHTARSYYCIKNLALQSKKCTFSRIVK